MRITLHGKDRGRILDHYKVARIAAFVFIIIFVGVIFGAAPTALTDNTNSLSNQLQQQQSSRKHLKIAFVGNSIIFIHDGPGLLVAMLEASGDYDTVEYDACLSAGASLVTLWRDHDPMVSGGCSPQFSTTGPMTMERLLVGDNEDPTQQQKKEWDFVVMNDQTMAPAFAATRRKSLNMLNTTYAPKLYHAGATPIFLQTAAYRTKKARDAYGLGTFEGFTQKLADGYQAYASTLTDYFEKQNKLQQPPSPTNQPCPTKAWIAPAGSAYAFLQHNPGKLDLFDKLYLDDDVHPSPYGTWLQACAVYSIITGKAPPRYSAKFWFKTARGPMRTRYPVPSQTEGNALRDVAWQIVRTMWRDHGVVSS